MGTQLLRSGFWNGKALVAPPSWQDTVEGHERAVDSR